MNRLAGYLRAVELGQTEEYHDGHGRKNKMVCSEDEYHSGGNV